MSHSSGSHPFQPPQLNRLTLRGVALSVAIALAGLGGSMMAPPSSWNAAAWATTEATESTEATTEVLTGDNVLSATLAQDNTLYLDPTQTHEYRLQAQESATLEGETVPAGAVIYGQFQPEAGGLRYVVDYYVIEGQGYGINAASGLLQDEVDPRSLTDETIVPDSPIEPGARIGTAAGLILDNVLNYPAAGDVVTREPSQDPLENVAANRVVVVEPNQSILLFAQ